MAKEEFQKDQELTSYPSTLRDAISPNSIEENGKGGYVPLQAVEKLGNEDYYAFRNHLTETDPALGAALTIEGFKEAELKQKKQEKSGVQQYSEICDYVNGLSSSAFTRNKLLTIIDLSIMWAIGGRLIQDRKDLQESTVTKVLDDLQTYLISKKDEPDDVEKNKLLFLQTLEKSYTSIFSEDKKEFFLSRVLGVLKHNVT